MLFGFKNAEAAYCRLVQKLVHMLGVEGVLAYLTNILLQTNDVISHVKLLNLVFQAHRAAGIELNADKTFLFKTEVKYLGHLISTEGISLIPAYVFKIVERLLPSTGKDLSSFLRFAGYYREFLPGFAEIKTNLNEIKNKCTLTWSTDRAGHVPTFLKSFRSVQERGPSAKSFRSRSSFFIVPFSFRSVPFRSVLGVLS